MTLTLILFTNSHHFRLIGTKLKLKRKEIQLPLEYYMLQKQVHGVMTFQ